MNLEEQLERELMKAKGIPFLFVGSGLSRRYLGLEDWSSLLKRFSIAREYQYYLSGANSFLPQVASAIAEDFFEIWWSPKYEAVRKKFSEGTKSRHDCLKFAVADYLVDFETKNLSKALSHVEIASLRNASIDGIITTNWDTLLENLFPDFKVYVGQRELLLQCPQEIAEIYKIHGCRTQPSSLVLTAEDYGVFNKANVYLAAKLVALFVERPIIFLGYSLTDPNIQQILKNIVDGIGEAHLDRLQNKLIFVQRDKDGEGDSLSKSTMSVSGEVLPVSIVKTNDFSKVFNATKHLKREYPARVLRTLKSHVYDLVKHADPGERVAVVDIENVDNYSDLEVVIGVGIVRELGEQGYVPINRTALLRDALLEKQALDPKRILDKVLPRLCRSPAKYIPLFKYASQANVDLNKDPSVDEKVRASAERDERFFQTTQYKKRAKAHTTKSIEELKSIFSADCVYYIPFLENIDLKELVKFCTDHFDEYTGLQHHSLRKTAFAQVCCLYDYLKWAKPKQAKKKTAKKRKSKKKR